jgi:hypothetical protein
MFFINYIKNIKFRNSIFIPNNTNNLVSSIDLGFFVNYNKLFEILILIQKKKKKKKNLINYLININFFLFLKPNIIPDLDLYLDLSLILKQSLSIITNLFYIINLFVNLY